MSGRFDFFCSHPPLLLKEDPTNSISTGTKVWKGSEVLFRYIQHNKKKFSFQGKRWLELGAGCGLLGISLCISGATVVMTDMGVMIPLLEQNANLNLSSDLELNKNFSVKELNWENDDVSHLSPPFDYIVGSELIYKKELVKPLLGTIFRLCDERTQILLAVEIRCETTHNLFLEIASGLFDVNQVPSNRYHPDHRDDDFVLIFSLRKK
eukprot:TRINITY_DN5746_c0_g1_i1.p1 TRINITY_DN5746_c0_g1~~TRINITY_DN5746_c0_g1_i1.p1  ORF type:complete len:209 (-),score=54.24 TRINITY_DN5746_c0_g1_i1:151-777(-)